MIIANNRRAWRLLFAVCCLVYMAWVGYLGSFDFNRVLREYRRAVERVEPGRIHTAALQELVAECRKGSEIHSNIPTTVESGPHASLIEGGVPAAGDCLAWPPAQVETRAAEIRERLLDRQKRAGWKLLLFSSFFVAMFLIFPPSLVYFLAVMLIKLFRSVIIVRTE